MEHDLSFHRRLRTTSIVLSVMAATGVALPAWWYLAAFVPNGAWLSGAVVCGAIVIGLLVHSKVFGPFLFDPMVMQRLGLRDGRIAPVYRISAKSLDNDRVFLEQYLWNGWQAVHRDQDFANTDEAQEFLRRKLSFSLDYIGPEFTGKDLMELGEDGPVSLRTKNRTDAAHNEAVANRKTIWITRAGVYAPLLIAGGVGAWGALTESIALMVVPDKTLLALAAGYAGTLVALWPFTNELLRKKWWRDVQRGLRAVRYRVIRNAGEERYWVQSSAVTHWVNKDGLVGDSIAEAEAGLIPEIRRIEKRVSDYKARRAEAQERRKVLMPFSVEYRPAESTPRSMRDEVAAAHPAREEVESEASVREPITWQPEAAHEGSDVDAAVALRDEAQPDEAGEHDTPGDAPAASGGDDSDGVQRHLSDRVLHLGSGPANPRTDADLVTVKEDNEQHGYRGSSVG